MSSHSTFRRRAITGLVGLAAATGVLAVDVHRPTVAEAAAAVTPILHLDATDVSSYSGSGTAWNDLSGNNRDGTISGSGVTFDAATKAMAFPGGTNGTAWVALAGSYSDFSGGVTIEFEGEFGATRAPWERIFDFAAAVGTTADAFWVGQLDNDNELALEVWNGGVSAGYCVTSTTGTALGTLGSRAFAKWVVTLGDVSGTNTCRIYKDGVELTTQYLLSNTTPSGSPAANGVPYPLPGVVSRPSALLGRSNFVADNDFEGSIRYIRIYDEALDPSEVGQNATSTVTFDANGGSGSMADQVSTTAANLTANAYTRTGRTFAGWNTAADGSGAVYTDTASYPFSSDATLYAQWLAEVTFDANGGTGSMADQTSTAPGTLSTNTFTRTGRTFVGWNTAADGSGTAYADGATFPFAADATLYAQWNAVLVPKTVTFDANGGAGSMAAQVSAVAATLTANTLTRAAHAFAGWNTAADGSGIAYADGATHPFSADVTLYAQWAPNPVGFVAVPTGRLYDSRDTASPIVGGGQVREIDVAGLLGVPADATAVVLNVTVTGATADGYVTVYPCGQDRPATSTVNFAAGQVVANSATVALLNGKVCVYSMSTTDVVLDVNGAYSPSVGVSLLETFAPYRLLDSRLGGVKLAPLTPVEITVTDAPGVPDDATAVVLNVTATEPDGAGFVTAYACGDDIPLASNLNVVAGQTVPNLVTVEVGPGGKVCLASSVATHLVVDASAALSPTGAAEFLALTPDRLVDTRASLRLTAGVPFELAVAGQGGVDPDAAAVSLNVTVTGPAGDGYVTSYPCGAAVPLASNLNFVAGQTVANAVTAELVDGRACFVSSVDTDLVVDVSGQYLWVT